MEEVISLEHSGFAPSRSIYEGIILAHEAIHSIRLSKKENMMIKVDIKKAYDEVNRDFLLKVLAKFGLDPVWIS